MSFLQEYRNRPRRVVFYGLVSTEHEAQVSALDNQMDWYQELATKNPNWEMVGQYVDEGITGTQATKRRTASLIWWSPARSAASPAIRWIRCPIPGS